MIPNGPGDLLHRHLGVGGGDHGGGGRQLVLRRGGELVAGVRRMVAGEVG